MPMTGKEMIRHLKKNGFQKKKGGKGGHQKMYNPKTDRTTEVQCTQKNWEKE